MSVPITTPGDVPARAAPRPKVGLGHARIDDVTMAEALDRIEALVAARRGGVVVTPNVDHVVLLEQDPRLRRAYAAASLQLADGTPLLWAARLLGTPLREKVSGSDLIRPLLERAAARRLRVYFLGGAPGIAARAAERLARASPGFVVAGIDARAIDLDGPPSGHADLVAAITAARPDLVLVALGCPKQEILMSRIADEVQPAVCIGIGAGLDFVAGAARRAPRWVSAAGLEWLHRLAHDPRRLWRRYLVRDLGFLRILARELRARPHGFALERNRTPTR